jgi:hypothetical protein
VEPRGKSPKSVESKHFDLQDDLDLYELNLDRNHAIAKKGGACIASGWGKK